MQQDIHRYVAWEYMRTYRYNLVGAILLTGLESKITTADICLYLGILLES